MKCDISEHHLLNNSDAVYVCSKCGFMVDISAFNRPPPSKELLLAGGPFVALMSPEEKLMLIAFQKANEYIGAKKE